MVLNGLICADLPLSNYSLTHLLPLSPARVLSYQGSNWL